MAKILYIDDDALMTEVMRDNLEKNGNHAVRYEKRAAEAAATIESGEHFDIIVLDLMMRKGSLEAKEKETQTGYILYRVIRDCRPDVPILVLTVLKDEQAPTVLRTDNKLQWLRKPIDAEVLIARIDEELRK